jgi:hypothetical protein
MMRQFVVLLLATLFWPVIADAAPIPAGDAKAVTESRERARQLFRQGKRHLGEGDYAGALAAFVAAEKLHPSPLIDYNAARCLDSLGRLAEAIERYRAYVEALPQADNAAEVRQRVATLEGQLAELTRDPYVDLEQRADGAEQSERADAVDQQATTHYGAKSVIPPALSEGDISPPRDERPALRESASQPIQALPRRPPASQGRAARRPSRRPSSREAGGALPPAPGQRWETPPRDQGPIYKQWWFWVAVAAGAAITGFIIATAVSGSDEPASAGQQGGLTVAF